MKKSNEESGEKLREKAEERAPSAVDPCPLYTKGPSET